MSVTVDAVKELAEKAISAKCGNLGADWAGAGDAINFMLFGGGPFPGLVDGATLAAAANSTAASDLTENLALSMASDAAKAMLGGLIDKFASKMFGGLEITGEELLGPFFLLCSPTSIAPEPTVDASATPNSTPPSGTPESNQSSAVDRPANIGGFTNPFAPSPDGGTNSAPAQPSDINPSLDAPTQGDPGPDEVPSFEAPNVIERAPASDANQGDDDHEDDHDDDHEEDHDDDHGDGDHEGGGDEGGGRDD